MMLGVLAGLGIAVVVLVICWFLAGWLADELDMWP
jgi:hypothetical protein